MELATGTPIVIGVVGGENPKRADHLLPPTAARRIWNAPPIDGDFRPAAAPTRWLSPLGGINSAPGRIDGLFDIDGEVYATPNRAQAAEAPRGNSPHKRVIFAGFRGGLRITDAAEAARRHDAESLAPRRSWAVGLPPPRGQITTDAKEESVEGVGSAYAYSFALEWGGIRYESNLSEAVWSDENPLTLQIPAFAPNTLAGGFSFGADSSNAGALRVIFPAPIYARAGEFFGNGARVVAVGRDGLGEDGEATDDDDGIYQEIWIDGDFAAEMKRENPWLSPDNLPQGAIFSIRIYRNDGGGFVWLGGATPLREGWRFRDDRARGRQAVDPLVVAGRMLPPPPEADSVARHANGWLAVGAGSKARFSPPGVVMAYPDEFERDLSGPIRRVIEFSDRCLFLTDSRSYLAVGISPENLVFVESEITWPPFGATAARVGTAIIYAVAEGLAGYTGEGQFLLSQGKLDRRSFSQWTPDSAFGFALDGRYFLANENGDWLLYSPLEEGGALSRIRMFDEDAGIDDFDDGAHRLRITAALETADGAALAAFDGAHTSLFRWRPFSADGGPRLPARYESPTARFPNPTRLRAAKARTDLDLRQESRGFGATDRAAWIADNPRLPALGFFEVGGAYRGEQPGRTLGGGALPGVIHHFAPPRARIEIYANEELLAIENDLEKWLGSPFFFAGSKPAEDWRFAIDGNIRIAGAAVARDQHRMRGTAI